MTDKELLKQKLLDVKEELESRGYFLGQKGDLMDLLPDMKQYEFRFQDAIEEVWPEKAWWQVTNYWDIFQDSIMTGKTVDEVIEDILEHIKDDSEDEEHIITDRSEVLTDDEKPNHIHEECEGCKVSDSVFELVKDLDEGE